MGCLCVQVCVGGGVAEGESHRRQMSKQQRITSLTLTPLMMIAGEKGGKGAGSHLKAQVGSFLKSWLGVHVKGVG